MRRGSITINFAPCFSHGFFHLQRDDGVILGGVGAGDDEDIVLDHLGGGVAHRRGAQRLLQRHHRSGVAQARAVIDVVGAEQRAEHLLQQVVVFVGGLGAAVHRQRVRAIAPVNLHQPVGDVDPALHPRMTSRHSARSKAWVRCPGVCGVLRISGVVTRLGL